MFVCMYCAHVYTKKHAQWVSVCGCRVLVYRISSPYVSLHHTQAVCMLASMYPYFLIHLHTHTVQRVHSHILRGREILECWFLHSKVLVSALKSVGFCTQKCWFLHSKVLVPLLKSVGFFTQKCWFLHSKVLVSSLKSVGFFTQKCWFLYSKVLVSSLWNGFWSACASMNENKNISLTHKHALCLSVCLSVCLSHRHTHTRSLSYTHWCVFRRARRSMSGSGWADALWPTPRIGWGSVSSPWSATPATAPGGGNNTADGANDAL